MDFRGASSRSRVDPLTLTGAPRSITSHLPTMEREPTNHLCPTSDDQTETRRRREQRCLVRIQSSAWPPDSGRPSIGPFQEDCDAAPGFARAPHSRLRARDCTRAPWRLATVASPFDGRKDRFARAMEQERQGHPHLSIELRNERDTIVAFQVFRNVLPENRETQVFTSGMHNCPDLE